MVDCTESAAGVKGTREAKHIPALFTLVDDRIWTRIFLKSRAYYSLSLYAAVGFMGFMVGKCFTTMVRYRFTA